MIVMRRKWEKWKKIGKINHQVMSGPVIFHYKDVKIYKPLWGIGYKNIDAMKWLGFTQTVTSYDDMLITSVT